MAEEKACGGLTFRGVRDSKHSNVFLIAKRNFYELWMRLNQKNAETQRSPLARSMQCREAGFHAVKPALSSAVKPARHCKNALKPAFVLKF